MRLHIVPIAAAAAALMMSACATPSSIEGVQVADAGAIGRVKSTASDAVSFVVAQAEAGAEAIKVPESFQTPEDGLVADPFEPFNRAVFSLNNGLDTVLLEPAADLYSVIPQPGRNRVRDFLDNWKSPVWLANDLLQGEWDRAGNTTGRFLVNTTIGVLGFYDFAARQMDMPKYDEDFGQTLAVWGVGDGPYLMLPLLGPSTARDFVGRIADGAMDPLNYVIWENDGGTNLTVNASMRTVDIVDLRDRVRPAFDAIEGAADPYAQARAVYIQSRRERIQNGRETYEDLPDFE